MANPNYDKSLQYPKYGPVLTIKSQRENEDYDPQYPDDSDKFIGDHLNIQIIKQPDGSASLQFSVYEWDEDTSLATAFSGLPYGKAVQFTKMVRNFFERHKKDINEFLEK